jgi:serine/threonine protein phosphatase PrpC
MNNVTIETALGLYSTNESRTIDVGAGAQEGLLVVADGMGGHCTGWLGALLCVRPICERFAHPGTKTKFVGAADGFQDDWGWAGGMQSKAAAEYVYEECFADFGDLGAIPRDLEKMFLEIDRVIHNIPNHERITGLVASSIAATIEGTHVHGAHVGIGLALLLRAGSHQFESLVVRHYLHLVYERISKGIEIPPDIELPRGMIVNALGGVAQAGVGIDTFDVDIGPGDVFLLLSRLTNLTEDGLAQVVRKSVDANVSADELARAIERYAAETAPEPNDYSGREFAFTLAWARPSSI